jgi:hypothetical protein
MSATSARLIPGTGARRQAAVLFLLGILFLALAWLLHPNPYEYPVGVFLLGAGMLIATFFYPTRLIIASYMLTPLGLAIFLFFKHLIPGNQIFPAYILALGIGLLIIAFFTRRGYIGTGALTPAFLVIVVGIIEALLLANLTPAGFVSFMLSLWLPGTGLFLLGVIYFLLPGKHS